MVGYSITFVMIFLYVVSTTENLLNSIWLVKDSSLAVSSHTFKDEAPFNVFILSIGAWLKLFKWFISLPLSDDLVSYCSLGTVWSRTFWVATTCKTFISSSTFGVSLLQFMRSPYSL